MPKLRITRKGFTTKRGTRVKPTTFLAKDRGEPGRTPKAERWFEPSVRTGWQKDMPMAKRRRLVKSAHKGDLLASARSMQALANVTTDRETRVKAQADANYFFKLHQKRSK